MKSKVAGMASAAVVAAAGFAICFGIKALAAPHTGSATFMQNLALAAAAGFPALVAAAACLHFAGIVDLRETALRLRKKT